MTYQEALKARERARAAYAAAGILKKAEEYDDSKHPAQTPAEIFAAQEENAAEGKRQSAKAQQDKADAANLAKGQAAAADYQAKKKELDALTAVAPADYIDKMNQVVNRAQGEQAVRDIEQQKADASAALARKNLGLGAGVGALAGLGTAGAAYGLAGLFPSLKKRRLLRALIALSAGGAAGLGVGYGVNAGLNSGKLQGAYGTAKSRGLAALNALRGGQAQA